MTAPTRGAELSSETLVQVLWVAIPDDSTDNGGSPIDSYNLQWKIKDSVDDYVDLVGEDGNF